MAFARGETGRREYVIEFLGAYLSRSSVRDPQSDEAKLYREASPVSHITRDDPPFLLFHGDADEIVPYSQSEIFEAELTKKGIPVEFIRVPGVGHTADFIESNVPEHLGTIVKMFDRHLRNKQ